MGDSSAVSFHAWKFESALSGGSVPATTLGRFVNCRAVSVFGGSGNYNMASDAKGILEFQNSTHVKLSGIIRKKLDDQDDLPGKSVAIDLNSGAAIDDNRALLLFE